MAASRKFKILVSDKLSDQGIALLKTSADLDVIYEPTLGKDVEKLKATIKDVDGLVIRSGTTVTKDIFASALQLKLIGRAGIGVDNVDLNEASRRGVIVMNTPAGNTVTTAEHAISLMCSLARAIPQATASTKAGKWEKNKFMGAELTHKTLGVVGAGNIGKIVINRGQGLQMKVIAYDPFLTDDLAEKLQVERVELDALFKRSDFITVHTPLTEKTKNLLDKAAFAKMKKGVFIINAARGGIVNELDLVDAIQSGIVAGAALDVFEKEPVDPNHPLLKLEQVICTPHLGASTTEAQENVAIEVAEQFIDFFRDGTIKNAVNFPSLSGKLREILTPFQNLSEALGSLHGQLVEDAPKAVAIEYSGDITEHSLNTLTSRLVYGLLKPVSDPGTVNPVNAIAAAKDRGLTLTESKKRESGDFTNLITVTVTTEKKTLSLAGTVFGKSGARLVQFDGIPLEASLVGNALVIYNEDRPGVIGKIGTALGAKGVNISSMQLGSKDKKTAISFYGVEGDVSPSVIADLKTVDGIVSVRSVSFSN